MMKSANESEYKYGCYVTLIMKGDSLRWQKSSLKQNLKDY